MTSDEKLHAILTIIDRVTSPEFLAGQEMARKRWIQAQEEAPKHFAQANELKRRDDLPPEFTDEMRAARVTEYKLRGRKWQRFAEAKRVEMLRYQDEWLKLRNATLEYCPGAGVDSILIVEIPDECPRAEEILNKMEMLREDVIAHFIRQAPPAQ